MALFSLNRLDEKCKHFLMARLKLTEASKEAQLRFFNQCWPLIRDQALSNESLPKWGKHYLQENVFDQLFPSICKGLEEVITGYCFAEVLLFQDPKQMSSLQSVLKFFLYDKVFLDKVCWKHFLALFKQSPALFENARHELYRIFLQLFDEMKKDLISESVFRMVLGNLICFIPFLRPHENESVLIPYKEGDSWLLAAYNIEKIQMAGKKFLPPLYAYGCRPKDQNAPILFLFSGTPEFAADGSLLCYLSDFTPFHSVGHMIYKIGRVAIHNWVDKASLNGKKIQAYGISLGGALAYQMALDLHEKVSVHCYGSPGLYVDLKKLKEIEGSSYFHTGDFVSYLGNQPQGEAFIFHEVLTDLYRHPFLAHIRLVGGVCPTFILKVKNFSRKKLPLHKCMNYGHTLCSIPLFLLIGSIVGTGALFKALRRSIYRALSIIR